MKRSQRKGLDGEPNRELILELASDEGRAMIEAFRRERGEQGAPGELENGLVDLTTSLLHARQAATHGTTEELVREVLAGIHGFRDEAVGPDGRTAEDRLGLTLRGRLDAVEAAAIAGEYSRARRELLDLLRFFRSARRRPT